MRVTEPARRSHVSGCLCVSEAYIQDIVLVVCQDYKTCHDKPGRGNVGPSCCCATTSRAHLNTDPDTGAQTRTQWPRPCERKGVQTWKQSQLKQTITSIGKKGTLKQSPSTKLLRSLVVYLRKAILSSGTCRGFYPAGVYHVVVVTVSLPCSSVDVTTIGIHVQWQMGA